MARNILFNPETYDLSELLANGRVYRVPRFQRDYSWDEENWSELWEDILKLRSDPSERHYMGSVVIRKMADREYEVIDGQQRLTTLSIFVLAMIKRLNDLAAEGVDPGQNRERAQLFRMQYISSKNPAALTERSKLTLNRRNHDFYQNYLVQLRRPPSAQRESESNRKLLRALDFFYARLAEDGELERSGSAIGALLNDLVSLRLIFIGIEVEDELRAFTLFETLNARGVRLGPADLIKNFLFSSFSAEADIDAAEFLWDQIVEAVTYENIPDLIRYYFCRFHRVIRNEQLLKLTKQRAGTPEEALEFLLVLEEEAEVMGALKNEKHPDWQEDKLLAYQVKVLNLFGVKQLFPILLVAKKSFSSADFKKLMKLLIACSFRYTVIGRKSPSELEPFYNGAAMGIEAGEIKRPRAVFDSIRETYPDDKQFENAFAAASLEFKGRKKKQLKYILTELEQKLGGRFEDFEDGSATLEHIYPQNPSPTWTSAFDKHHDAYLERLANYTLLEKDLNKDVANAPFAAKKTAYAHSAFKMTAAIVDCEDWTPSQIDVRQAEWAKLACDIWRADY